MAHDHEQHADTHAALDSHVRADSHVHALDHDGHHQRAPEPAPPRDFARRAYTVGIGGPVGSGKTALLLALCRALRNRFSLGVVTNDVSSREDAEFLQKNRALSPDCIRGVETGCCPHTAIHEDIHRNLDALDQLMIDVKPELLFLESGGDNLSTRFSPALVDYTIYVIDVGGGDKVPRKGGPGIAQSDLLVINKTDLAPHVGADLAVMARDAQAIRGERPFVFSQARSGVGLDPIIGYVLGGWREAIASAAAAR